MVVITALSALTLQYGNGIHQWNVPLSKVLQFFKVGASTFSTRTCANRCHVQLSNAVEIVYCITALSTKVAILLQIQHIFITSRKSIRFLLVQLVIWINALWYFINIFLNAFPCTPRAKIWDPLLPGHCSISYNVVDYISCIFNMVSDLFILVLPIMWVWKLQMPRKRKFGVSLIFASGIL